jgi:hypothetical protein
MSKTKELIGLKFERLTVLCLSVRNANGKQQWECVCDCGNKKIISEYRLITGVTKSCGCIHREQLVKRNTKHGLYNHELYPIWTDIKQRCNNLDHQSYENYGGRDITICKRWTKFEVFLRDIGEKPFLGAELDRKDNDGNYQPGNVKWVTRTTNQRNKRTNHKLTYKNKTLCMSEWVELTGITESAIRNRLRSNWSIDKILTTPVKKTRR